MKTPPNKLEVRFCLSKVTKETRAEGKAPLLVGYAAMFNSLSQDLGGFKERIAPGAFAQALKSGDDIRALVDHDFTKILGRTSAGTLTLREDDTGLRVECDAPDTSYARDLMVSVERGDISGMSFGFNIFPDGERWAKENDYYVRELTNIDLREVTATSIPAYQATELYVRVAPGCAEHVRSLTQKNFEQRVKRGRILRTILAGG